MNKYAGAMIGVAASTILIAGAYAQTDMPKGTQFNPGQVMPGNGTFIVIGCVTSEGQGAARTFLITDSRPTPPARYRLEGDVNLLQVHLGHMLEVAGLIAPTPLGGSMPSLKVQALTYLATTCIKLK